MVEVDDDYSRVDTALEALDGVSAANLNEEVFSKFKKATQNLEDVKQSLSMKPDCSFGEDGE